MSFAVAAYAPRPKTTTVRRAHLVTVVPPTPAGSPPLASATLSDLWRELFRRMFRRTKENLVRQIPADDPRRAALRAGLAVPAPGAGTTDLTAVLAAEPLLARRYASAEGLTVDLSGIPRYRHAQTLEEALTAWEAGHSAAMCDACGTIAHRWADDRRPSHENNSALPPKHRTRRVTLVEGESRDLNLCGFCADADVEVLPYKVFAAIGGYRGSTDERVRFAFEIPNYTGGEPWAHVDRGAIIGRMRARFESGEAMRSYAVVTTDQAKLFAAQAGRIAPKLHHWTDVPKIAPSPALPPVPVDPNSPGLKQQRQQIADLDAARLRRRTHDALLEQASTELAAMSKTAEREPSGQITGRSLVEWEAALSMFRKRHADNGCTGSCAHDTRNYDPSYWAMKDRVN